MQKRTTPSEHSEWEERGIAKKGVGRGQGTGVAHLEIRVVHVFEHQRRSARLRSKRKESNGIEIEMKAHSSWVEPAARTNDTSTNGRSEKERRGSNVGIYDWVFHDRNEVDDIHAAAQVLQDFDFTLNLLLLYRLQYLRCHNNTSSAGLA